MPDLAFSITIANWNTRKDLEDCLRSLEAVRDEAPFEVIVVDNASTDGSADMVEKLQILNNYTPKPGASYANDADFLHYAIEW